MMNKRVQAARATYEAARETLARELETSLGTRVRAVYPDAVSISARREHRPRWPGGTDHTRLTAVTGPHGAVLARTSEPDSVFATLAVELADDLGWWSRLRGSWTDEFIIPLEPTPTPPGAVRVWDHIPVTIHARNGLALDHVLAVLTIAHPHISIARADGQPHGADPATPA